MNLLLTLLGCGSDTIDVQAAETLVDVSTESSGATQPIGGSTYVSQLVAPTVYFSGSDYSSPTDFYFNACQSGKYNRAIFADSRGNPIQVEAYSGDLVSNCVELNRNWQDGSQAIAK